MKPTFPLFTITLLAGALGAACSAAPEGEPGESSASALTGPIFHLPTPPTYTGVPGGALVSVPVDVPSGWSQVAPVTVSITGLPAGVTATFVEATCNGLACLDQTTGPGSPAQTADGTCSGFACINQTTGLGAPAQTYVPNQATTASSPAMPCGSGCGGSFQLQSSGEGGIAQRADLVVSNGTQSYSTPITIAVSPCVPTTCAAGQCGLVANGCGGFVSCDCRTLAR